MEKSLSAVLDRGGFLIISFYGEAAGEKSQGGRIQGSESGNQFFYR